VPRAVPPWLHRVCIRMYGPDDPWSRLLLFAHNSCMDDAGSHFHSQESIAKAAAMGVSTVRAKNAELSKAGWLAIYPRHQPGQAWKSYEYRCCVPDSCDLASIRVKKLDGEYLASTHEAQYGGIDSENCTGSLYPQKGSKRQPPPPAHGGSPSTRSDLNAPSHERTTASSRADYRQLTSERPPAHGGNDRQPVGEKSSSEVLKVKFSGEGRIDMQSHIDTTPLREPSRKRARA
jgi:hypothetical protein